MKLELELLRQKTWKSVAASLATPCSKFAWTSTRQVATNVKEDYLYCLYSKQQMPQQLLIYVGGIDEQMGHSI